MNYQNLFVVLNTHGSVQERDCTLAEAAEAVMNYDGHDYEIRPAQDGHGFELFVTQFSRNSTGGGLPLIKSVIFSLADDIDAAKDEIFQQVIKRATWWSGCEVMEQREYDLMREEIEAEDAAA